MAALPFFYAPVRLPGGTEWLPLQFTPQLGKGDPITLDPTVRFLDPDAVPKLGMLRAAIRDLVARIVGNSSARHLNEACPLVSLAGSRSEHGVVLSTKHNRSWELAYVLACLASAGFGRWQGLGVVWATGVVSVPDDTIVVDELKSKTEFFLEQVGQILFMAPDVVVPGPLPLGKSGVAVARISDLFTVEGSPLRDAPYDPRSYDALGRPAVWSDLGGEPWWTTRLSTVEQLAQALSNPKHKLIVVSAAVGWGKTSLLARAFRRAEQKAMVVNLDNVTGWNQVFQSLFLGQTFTEEEKYCIDHSLLSASRVARTRIPTDTLFVFVNSSANDNGAPTKEVRKTVESLIEQGYRCVVEVWDDVDWTIGRIAPEAECLVPQQEIPPLNRDEVECWLRSRGHTSRDVIDAFGVLGGHPLGISYTLKKLDDARKRGIEPSPNRVQRFAFEWSELKDLPNYIARFEHLVPNIPDSIRDWFAIMWPTPLAVAQDNETIDDLIRFGHATISNGFCTAGGWLHLYCIKLLRDSQPLALALRDEDLAAILPEHARMTLRNLEALRARLPSLARPLAALAETLHLTTERCSQTLEDEYIAPAEVLLGTRNEDQPAHIAWQLEQLCRSSRWEDARKCADRLLSMTGAVDGLLEGWQATRCLDTAVRLAMYARQTDFLDLPSWSDLVLTMLAREDAKSVWIARLALRLADLHSAQKSRDDARWLVTSAEPLIERLFLDPETPQWILGEIGFRALTLEYSAQGNLEDRRAALEEMLESTGEDAIQWPTALVWVLLERARLSADSLEVPDSIRTLFMRLAPTPKVVFLLRGILFAGIIYNWGGPLSKLAIEYVNAVRTMQTLPQEVRLSCDLLTDPMANSSAVAKTLIEVWQEPACVSGGCLSLTGVLLVCDSADLIAGSPEVLALFKMLEPETVLDATLERGDLELSDFWGGWFLRQTSKARHAYQNACRYHAQRLDSQPDDDAELRVRQVFKEVADRGGILLPLVLTYWYTFEWFSRRRAIVDARRANGNADASDALVESVLDRFDRECPESSFRHAAWTAWAMNTCQYDKALDSADAALLEAHSTTDRTTYRFQQLGILVSCLYSSPEWHSSVSPTIERERALDFLDRVIADLDASLPGDRKHVHHFRKGLDLDQIYWRDFEEQLADELRPPDDCWCRLLGVYEKDYAALERLCSFVYPNDASLMYMVARTMSWASTRPELSDDLRKRLAVDAATSFLGAMQFERSRSSCDIDTELAVATSLAMALRHGPGEELFGAPLSPISDRSTGQQLGWVELVDSLFQSVSDQAVGRFAIHAREIRERFRTPH